MKSIGDSNKNTLFQSVYDEIAKNILDGTLKPGESLTEHRLSEELGVSRTPIREALRRLEQNDLIRYIPNKGAVVVGISDKDIADVYEIRMLIEGLAAEWAAERITDEELSRLRDIVELQEYYASKKDFEQVLSLDSRFHDVLYDACRSRILCHVLETFHGYVIRVRGLSLKSNSRIINSVEEHRAIYEALAAHDAKKAGELLSRHISNARKNIETCL